MKKSPLKLEASFLEQVNFEPNGGLGDDFPPIPLEWDDAYEAWGLRGKVDMSLIDKDKRRYAVRLLVKMGKDKFKEEPPYSFEIVMVGIFSVREQFTDDHDKLASVNGASILYGSIRELVRHLSERGPYFPLLLPAVMFPPISTEPPGEQAEETEALPSTE